MVLYKHQCTAYTCVSAYTSPRWNPSSLDINTHHIPMADRQTSAFSSSSHNPSIQDGTSSPGHKPHRYPIPAGVQPTNCIQISSVNSVQGVYTIDPGLTPPASLFGTLPRPYGYQDIDKQNVLIESQGGNVYVDIFFLPSDKQNMISMTVKSYQGSASVRVVRCSVHPVHCRGIDLREQPTSTMLTRTTTRAFVDLLA